MGFKIGKIRITPKNLIWFILVLTLFMNILSDAIGLPTAIRYLNDLAVFALFILMIAQRNFFSKVRQLRLNGVAIAVILYTFANIASVLLNGGNPALILWATRNTYRFFVFYFACVLYWEKSDLEKFFSFCYKIQWVNLALVLYQFFVLGLKQDFLGGIFGYGGNAGLLIYSVLIVAYAMTKFMRKEYPTGKFLFIFISATLCSVLAELRVYFFFVAFIFAVNLVQNSNWTRKLGIAIIGGLLLIIGLQVYASVFPYVDLSITAILKEGNSHGGGYNISRLNAFQDINQIFFQNDVIENFFGYGFGNCEYSTIPIFTSTFHEHYGEYHYRWFTHQWIFLESGYLGVISYLSILFSIAVHAFRTGSASYKSATLICEIMTVIAGVSFFYNSLLKADFGYIAFLAMAISGIMYRSQKSSDAEEKRIRQGDGQMQ